MKLLYAAAFLLSILTVTTLWIGNNDNTTEISEARQGKSDSLVAITDSLIMKKNLSRNFKNMHIHNSQDIAKNAHQDLPKARRILTNTRKEREFGMTAYAQAEKSRQKKAETYLYNKKSELF